MNIKTVSMSSDYKLICPHSCCTTLITSEWRNHIDSIHLQCIPDCSYHKWKSDLDVNMAIYNENLKIELACKLERKKILETSIYHFITFNQFQITQLIDKLSETEFATTEFIKEIDKIYNDSNNMLNDFN